MPGRKDEARLAAEAGSARSMGRGWDTDSLRLPWGTAAHGPAAKGCE